jgi:predicted nucleic acid-binding protein
MAPVLLWFEVRNALIVNERRGRVTAERVEAFLSDLDLLPIAYEPLPESARVLTLARLNKLTIYDAVYLELAVRTGFPLATLDAALAIAIVAAGGSLFEAG